MKTALLFAVSLASAGVAVSAMAADYQKNGYIYQALVQVCSETADDDRLGLHNTLKAYRISKQTAVEKVVCNGQQLMDFARANQAVKVATMLQPYEDRIKGRVTIHDVAAPAAN
ncbi:DUF3718 domain-containing protein [Rheinheimera sp. YQF-2]|jgi:hypothetical protein|uniref:DUF3718 domain-containing protein n=1 Tax=Rheinheimera lutimaris TaxID=2740584 RepID=A0A7Y5ATH6_9GAMM|nr:DUF3718 domain-containing protein [Rheinheimera lutimaris]NRQ44275.1 DUF3718 domain-containing protein [Rheinheimera lutimaris]